MYLNTAKGPVGTQKHAHRSCAFASLPCKSLNSSCRSPYASALQRHTRHRSLLKPATRQRLTVSAIATTVDRPAAYSGMVSTSLLAVTRLLLTYSASRCASGRSKYSLSIYLKANHTFFLQRTLPSMREACRMLSWLERVFLVSQRRRPWSQSTQTQSRGWLSLCVANANTPCLLNPIRG